MHLYRAELHAVHPLRVVLVGGARVTCQYAGQGGAVGLRHLCQQFGRELYLQTVELGLAGKALGGIRVAVGIGDVRLDVVDGGAIHQVGTAHDEHRANVRPVLDAFQTHAGKAQRIGAERRPGGEHAHAGVAAQTRRAYSGGPAVPHRAGELPHQPDVTKIFQTAHGIGIAVFGRKDHLAAQLVHKAALARDAELGGKGSMDMGNDLQGHLFRCSEHGELLLIDLFQGAFRRDAVPCPECVQFLRRANELNVLKMAIRGDETGHLLPGADAAPQCRLLGGGVVRTGRLFAGEKHEKPPSFMKRA